MPSPFSDLRSVSCRASVLCLSWPSASDFSRFTVRCLHCMSIFPFNAAGGRHQFL